MKPELDNQSVHRYMRVYNYYKQLILSQQLAPGSRAAVDPAVVRQNCR